MYIRRVCSDLVFFVIAQLFIILLVAGASVPQQVKEENGMNRNPSNDLGHRDAAIWEYEEWTLDNPSYSGNPFDLVATVTFSHRESHRETTTEMFYSGNDQWKFRFTGTAVGAWDFATSSADPDLDGYTGTVNVNGQTDLKIKGFLTHVGNQFAIMDRDDQSLRGYVYQVYMNQQDFAQQYHQDKPRPLDDTSRVDDYWEDTQKAGFDIYFVFVAHSWLRLGALDNKDRGNNENPDLQTFDNLEYIINYAHSRGGRTHIWAWGDNGRKQTPNQLPGGVRGEAHQRLLRYIAARLGPLPGWAMNFGFDTIEMPNAEADTEWWANFLNQRFGWRHLLCSRGWESEAFGIDSYAGFTTAGYELVTTDKGPEDFNEIAEDLDTNKDRPLLYEERHTYNRWVNWPNRVPDPARLNMNGTRRLLWWEIMASGAGGFFGYFSDWFNEYGPFEGYYPHREQLRCARNFWRDRYMLDMERANHLIDEGYCLRTTDNRNFVFYAEDTSSISYDISEMSGAERVIAVDVKKEYKEIDLGAKSPGCYTYSPGYISDWVIAAGDFYTDAPANEH